MASARNPRRQSGQSARTASTFPGLAATGKVSARWMRSFCFWAACGASPGTAPHSRWRRDGVILDFLDPHIRWTLPASTWS